MPPGSPSRAARIATTAAAGAALGMGWLLLVAEAMVRPLNHDESWFLAAAALLRTGLVPFRDFPCLHPPNYFLLAAPAAVPGSFLTLSGRLASATAAVAVAALVGHLVRRNLEGRAGSASLYGLAAAAVVVFDPLLAATAGRATNYVFPSVAALLAVLAAGNPRDRRRRPNRVVVAGFWLAVATGFRVSYAGAAAAFGLVLLLEPDRSRAGRARDLARLGLGGLAGAVPSLLLLALAPRRFLFGTLEYHTLQPAFHRTYGWDRAMDLAGKLRLLVVDVVAGHPAVLLLLAGLAAAAALTWRAARSRGRPGPSTATAAGAVAVALLVTAELPTPTWTQYLFAPVPFAVLATYLVLGREGRGAGAHRRFASGVAIAVAAGTVVLALPRLGALPRLFAPEGWAPVLVHQLGVWTAEQTAGGGAVVSLAPVVPLEGGAAVDPAFATGPFVWRVAHRVDPERRHRLGLVSREDLDRRFADRPPAALLLGFDETLERPLLEWARRRGYRRLEGPPPFSLWLAPDPVSSVRRARPESVRSPQPPRSAEPGA